MISPETKLWFKQEAISVLHTMIAFFAVDAAGALTQLFNGNWDKILFYQLGFALLRSAVKALLTEAIPSLFKKPPVV